MPVCPVRWVASVNVGTNVPVEVPSGRSIGVGSVDAALSLDESGFLKIERTLWGTGGEGRGFSGEEAMGEFDRGILRGGGGGGGGGGIKG
jgi:hypothetical protein